MWPQAVYEPTVTLIVGVDPVDVAVGIQMAVGSGEAFGVINES